MAKTKGKAGVRRVGTKNDLADCLGVERTTLHRYWATRDMPDPEKDGSFDVAKFTRWARKCGFLKTGEVKPVASGKYEEELHLIRLKSRLLELDLAKKEGHAIPRDEHVAVLQFLNQLYASQLLNFPKAVAAFCRDPIVVKRAEELVEGILRRTREAVQAAAAAPARAAG